MDGVSAHLESVQSRGSLRTLFLGGRGGVGTLSSPVCRGFFRGTEHLDGSLGVLSDDVLCPTSEPVEESLYRWGTGGSCIRLVKRPKLLKGTEQGCGRGLGRG